MVDLMKLTGGLLLPPSVVMALLHPQLLIVNSPKEERYEPFSTKLPSLRLQTDHQQDSLPFPEHHEFISYFSTTKYSFLRRFKCWELARMSLMDAQRASSITGAIKGAPGQSLRIFIPENFHPQMSQGVLTRVLIIPTISLSFPPSDR